MTPTDGNAVHRRTETILNQRGLHARAAARLAETAGTFTAEITVTRDGQTVSARSIMGLMMLAAAPGTKIEITATGPDAEQALDALAALIRARFDEDE